MARALRLLAGETLYHVIGKATGTDRLYVSAKDYRHFLRLLGRVVVRFRWRCFTYCMIGTHYHLLVETPEPSLARGMQRLNGMYAQAFNRRHERSGHLFGDRYYSRQVDGDAYALELVRYIALNPVRAGLCASPAQWPWSSYAAMIGNATPPAFLESDETLRWFSPRREAAIRRLQAFVEDSLRSRDGV
jgi:REP-associated tyrosine transposase